MSVCHLDDLFERESPTTHETGEQVRNRCRVFVDGSLELPWVAASSIANVYDSRPSRGIALVVREPVAHVHDDLVLETIRLGQLGHACWIAAGHDRSSLEHQPSRRARSDEPRFGACYFRDHLTRGDVQVVHVDHGPGRLLH